MFYLSYVGYELKKWMRDSLTSFMVFYPLLLGLVGRYVIPLADQRTHVNLEAYYHVILTALILFVSRISGSVAAFSILDDRDDNILYSVKVAPLSLEFFIGLKLLMVFVLSFAGAAFILWFSDLVTLPTGVLFAVAFLASMGCPLTTLVINCVASNKVEGFAAVKALNSLVLFAIASLFFWDKKEFLFAFEPGFWPAKALSTAIIGEEVMQLSYNSYYAIGLAYALLLNIGAYMAFKKRVH